MQKTLFALLGLLAILSSGCGTKKEPVAARPETVPVVSSVTVSRQTLHNDLKIVAEFQPYQEIDVMAKVAGYVNQLNVDMGSRVKAGAVLAVLEVPEMMDDLRRSKATIQRASADVERARDDIRRTEATLDMAKLSYERLGSVSKTKPGLIAQQEIDAARTRLLEAEAQVAAAKSTLASMQQSVEVNRAEQARTETVMNFAKVVAPFPGVITKRYATVGAMIQAGTSSATSVMPVVRMAEDQRLRLALPVPESAVPLIRVGFPVEVRVPTLGKSIGASVSRFAGQLQLTTRTMTAEVDVLNAGLEIKPGMFAEVTFPLATVKDVLSLPLGALDGTGIERSALRVGGQGILEAVKVQVGLETAERVQVMSGLDEGDVVVASGRARLKAGDRVSAKAGGK